MLRDITNQEKKYTINSNCIANLGMNELKFYLQLKKYPQFNSFMKEDPYHT